MDITAQSIVSKANIGAMAILEMRTLLHRLLLKWDDQFGDSFRNWHICKHSSVNSGDIGAKDCFWK